MTAKVRQEGRKGFLFCTGGAAVAAGLWLGWSGVIVDCLLVFSVCLTAAVLVVALSAKSVQEIRGFGTLAVAATAVQVATCAAAGKLILAQGGAGRIVEFFAGALARGNLIFGVLIFFGVGCLVWSFIARSLRSIRRTVTDFVKGECPDRYASFFAGMRASAGFMMFGAIAETCIIVLVTAGGLVTGSRGEFGMSAGEGVALAVATGTVTLAMGAGCVLGGGYLVGRARKSAQWEGRGDVVEWEPAAKTVASEVVCEEESAAARIGEMALKIDGAEAEEAQWYEGGEEVEERCGREARFWNGAEMRDKDSCEQVVERIIAAAKASSRVILLAAAERKELGVTAAVNIAMSLAQRGRKCLLVDMDMDRDAVSRVFDTAGKGPGAAKTCIANLWVQRGEKGHTHWQNEHDHVVLYSPDRKWWPRVDSIANDTMTALLFGSDEDQSIGEFRENLDARKVNVLKPEFVTKV